MSHIRNRIFCFGCNNDSSICWFGNNVLFIILRVNRNWLNQSEKIYLDKLYVKLEKGKNDITFDRFLSKFSIVDHKTKKEYLLQETTKKLKLVLF